MSKLSFQAIAKSLEHNSRQMPGKNKYQKDVTLSVVEGHLFKIYQSQKVFDYAQTDNRGA
jgi:hypothetical protein